MADGSLDRQVLSELDQDVVVAIAAAAIAKHEETSVVPRIFALRREVSDLLDDVEERDRTIAVLKAELFRLRHQ
jgi:hypothetical protein